MSARPSPEIIAILEKLVAFDTTSKNSNLPLIDWVYDYLTGLGAATAVVRAHRPAKSSRHRAVRSYRCRAGHEPDLVERSVHIG
jgi:acetylornithine deacetylase/succinyl-diaminopimelate desuccinylase-like protein